MTSPKDAVYLRELARDMQHEPIVAKRLIKIADRYARLLAMLSQEHKWLDKWCECLGSDSNEPCSFCKRRHEIAALLKEARGD